MKGFVFLLLLVVFSIQLDASPPFVFSDPIEVFNKSQEDVEVNSDIETSVQQDVVVFSDIYTGTYVLSVPIKQTTSIINIKSNRFFSIDNNSIDELPSPGYMNFQRYG